MIDVRQGSDDHLIKVWCVETGRLMATLRGHEVRRLWPKSEDCSFSANRVWWRIYVGTWRGSRLTIWPKGWYNRHQHRLRERVHSKRIKRQPRSCLVSQRFLATRCFSGPYQSCDCSSLLSAVTISRSRAGANISKSTSVSISRWLGSAVVDRWNGAA